LHAPVRPEIYIPYTQSPVMTMAILVRAERDPAALAPAIRDQLRALDPNLPMTFMQTMDDVVGTSLADRRLAMQLLTAFGAVALFLTAIGIYAVIAATVGDRTREIAIRLALGGAPHRVVWIVVRQILLVTLVGIAA